MHHAQLVFSAVAEDLSLREEKQETGLQGGNSGLNKLRSSCY